MVDDLFDDLILLAHLVEVLAGGLGLNLRLEPVGGNLVVALALQSQALLVVGQLGPLELGVK